MPVKGTSRQCDRDCLVCGETTRIAHLGIECCRACAVFYRRARRGNDYSCRSGTGHCPAGKGLNCTRCRYDRIITLLDRARAEQDEPVNEDTSPVDEATETPSSCRPFLERVKLHYNVMCFNRLSTELNSRRNPPHPLEISLETGPFFPADFSALSTAMRALLTAALEFGRNVFPEFAGLENADKWKLARNFFFYFRMFESCYRGTKIFANDLNKFFVSYAMYFTIPFDGSVFSTAPEGADLPAALEFMRNTGLPDRFSDARKLVARVNPTEEEFLVVAVLFFWTTSDPSMSDSIRRIGEKYRAEILKDLHAYYRDELGLDDYAARLGELMMLMQVFEQSDEIKEHFEVLRLLNVMTEDNFIYSLQRDLTIK